MILKSLTVNAFRNIDSAAIVADDRLNIFHGNNAQGKTNLLESIFLLGTMKSFRMAKNQELVQWGAANAILKGTVAHDGIVQEINLLINSEGKKARVDQKALTRLADFFGCLNVVVFSPEELQMVRGMPENRRRYLDRAIFSCDISYLALHHEYCKILRQRNALLRKGETHGLEVWSEQLAEAGSRIVEKRVAYLEKLGELLQLYYRNIAGLDETATITYLPHKLNRDSQQFRGETRELLLAAIQRCCMEEKRLGTTLVGPHRDDIEFRLGSKALKHYGSQGEQRSFILALKMAEIEYMQRRFGHPPILLLDDMTSELDQDRNRNLMEFLEQKAMQVFITTTHLENIRMQGITRYKTFLVEDGTVIH